MMTISPTCSLTEKRWANSDSISCDISGCQTFCRPAEAVMGRNRSCPK